MFTYNTNIWATSATAKSRGLMKVWGVGRSVGGLVECTCGGKGIVHVGG